MYVSFRQYIILTILCDFSFEKYHSDKPPEAATNFYFLFSIQTSFGKYVIRYSIVKKVDEIINVKEGRNNLKILKIIKLYTGNKPTKFSLFQRNGFRGLSWVNTYLFYFHILFYYSRWNTPCVNTFVNKLQYLNQLLFDEKENK